MNILILSLSILILACITQASAVQSNSTTRRPQKLSDHEDSMYIQDILRAAKAAEIQSYLDENINPCSDFYQFSCGKFAKLHPAQAFVGSSMLQIMSDALKARAKGLLSAPDNDDELEIARKVKRFFASCMNIKDLSGSYKSKLMSVIGEFGKMPVLYGNVNWDENDFDWIAMIAKMQREYGKPALFQLDVAQDFRDNRINCLYIGQPQMLMSSKAMYVDNATAIYRSAVATAIKEKLEKFLDVPTELAQSTADEIMAFEILLANGMWDGKNEADKMNTPTSTAHLVKKYAPIIDVERFLNLTLGITQANCMYESVESFQANLKGFLTQVPKYVVANYLYFMLLKDDFFLRSESTESAQRELCLAKVKSYFSKVIDNMVYRQSHSEKLEKDLHIIFNNLKETLKDRFLSNELDWMKPKSRFNAIEKLQETRLEINVHDAKDLTAEFEEVDFKADNYIENVHNLLLSKGRKFVALFGEKPKSFEPDQWSSFTPINLIQKNLIKVPVATLQPNFLWAQCYPNAVKFGNLGSLLGHEIIHGFDDEGRKFDKRGNQNNWWDLDSMQAFNERKKCFVDQYSKYSFGSSYLRGDFVLSENIADNGGIKLAYDAYQHWYNNVNRTQDLQREKFSSLKYSPTQLFFISFAQFWCSDINEHMKDLSIATDNHSPNMYRVIGSLSNLPEFSTAFRCPIGSRMNPEKKCRIY